jgi:cell division topological specificity factor
MGLFTDFYNTVAKFFRPQEEHSEGDPSKSVATNRLKLVLMQDRTNLTPKVLEQMRGELVDLLSKYLEMDKDLLELNFEQEGDQVALMLSIPVIRAKDENEIEESIRSKVLDDSDDEETEFSEEDDDNDNNETEEDDDEKNSETDRSQEVTSSENLSIKKEEEENNEQQEEIKE